MDWTGLRILTEPTAEPVTVAELKTYMRLDGSTYDTMLAGFIKAARRAIEGHCGRTLMPTTRQLFLDEFPDDNAAIELPYGPVQSVSSISYLDADGVAQTLAAGKYKVDLYAIHPRIAPEYSEDWPDTRGVINSVTVTYLCGYAHGHVPEPLKECIKALCSDLFEHPEAEAETLLSENRTYQFLLNSYTIPGVA